MTRMLNIVLMTCLFLAGIACTTAPKSGNVFMKTYDPLVEGDYAKNIELMKQRIAACYPNLLLKEKIVAEEKKASLYVENIPDQLFIFGTFAVQEPAAFKRIIDIRFYQEDAKTRIVGRDFAGTILASESFKPTCPRTPGGKVPVLVPAKRSATAPSASDELAD